LAGITIQPLHNHADMMLDQLALQVADTTAGDKEGDDKLPEEAGDKEGDDKLPEEASSSMDAGKAGGKDGQPMARWYGEKGGGKDGQQKRGGWLPKMVTLVRAIKSEDWEQANQLAEDYSQVWSLKELMDKADKAEKAEQSKWGWQAHKTHMELEKQYKTKDGLYEL
jgi:hypothetical protein